MGQYHVIVNLTKKQFLHPHRFGDGLKLLEFGSSGSGIMLGLALLLARDNGLGGGDLCLEPEHPHAKLPGSWAGDQIVIAGDYGDKGKDAPADMSLYALAKEAFEDVSHKVILAMCADPCTRADMVGRLTGGFGAGSDESKALLVQLRGLYPDVKKIEASVLKARKEARKENEEVRA